jgi:hypothetical protein
MSNRKKRFSKSGLPELDLKGPDFAKSVPEGQKLELTIVWKGQGYKNETLGPVHAFAKLDGKFKVINRALQDMVYVFDVKEIKTVILLPIDIFTGEEEQLV